MGRRSESGIPRFIYVRWPESAGRKKSLSGNDHWPKSWDDLLTVLESDEGRRIPLRGAEAGDLRYARSLRQKVLVDWSFNPATPSAVIPVTTHAGEKFPVTWSDPNEMVRLYLSERASTRPSAAR
jgi:hypothetical protein